MRQTLIQLSALCLITVSLSACEFQAKSIHEESVRTEADIEAIRTLVDQYMTTFEAGDLDAAYALFTDDMVLMPPNEPILEGKQACRVWSLDWFQPLSDQYTFKETISIPMIEVSGSWAIGRGTYEFQKTPKSGGEPMQDVGKLIWIFQRQFDGSWKIACNIWNSDTPPSPGGESTP